MVSPQHSSSHQSSASTQVGPASPLSDASGHLVPPPLNNASAALTARPPPRRAAAADGTTSPVGLVDLGAAAATSFELGSEDLDGARRRHRLQFGLRGEADVTDDDDEHFDSLSSVTSSGLGATGTHCRIVTDFDDGSDDDDSHSRRRGGAASPVVVPAGSCYDSPLAFVGTGGPNLDYAEEESLSGEMPPGAVSTVGSAMTLTAVTSTTSLAPAGGGGGGFSRSRRACFSGKSGTVELTISAMGAHGRIPIAVKTIEMTDSHRRESAETEVAFAERVSAVLATPPVVSPDPAHAPVFADAISNRSSTSPSLPVPRQHPVWRHIAQLHGARIDAETDRCTVVSEALLGGSLGDFVRPRGISNFQQQHQQPVPHADINLALRVVARELLLALQTLHDTFGVLHNDLKLDNIMLIGGDEEETDITAVAADVSSTNGSFIAASKASSSSAILAMGGGVRCGCLLGLRPPAMQHQQIAAPEGEEHSTRHVCTRSNHIKVIDFGCASVVESTFRPFTSLADADNKNNNNDVAAAATASCEGVPSVHPDRHSHSRLPSANETWALPQRGALAVMSPERLRGSAYGCKSDVWSLGAILLQLARGGRHPFLDPPAVVIATSPGCRLAASRASTTASPMSDGLDASASLAAAATASVSGGGGNNKFWRLAAVLHFVDALDECESATRSCVTAALNECAPPLATNDDFRSFMRRALQPDPLKRASVADLLGDPWLAPKAADQRS